MIDTISIPGPWGMFLPLNERCFCNIKMVWKMEGSYNMKLLYGIPF